MSATKDALVLLSPTGEQRALAATEIEKLIRSLLRLFAGFDETRVEDEELGP